LRIAPLQWLGSRSYSAYLWHWPVLIVGAAALGRDLTVTEGLLFTAGSVVLSELSWRWPEETVRRATVLRGARAAMFAAALVSLVAGAGVLVRNNPPTVPTAGEADAPVLTGTSTSTTVAGTSTLPPIPTTTVPTPPTLPGPSAPIEAVVTAAATTGLPSNLEPNLDNVRNDMPRIYSNGCHAGFGATVPKRCVVGDENSDVVVGVYGDSHAAQWFPMFEKIAIKRKWKLIYYTKRGCPPAEIEVYSSVLGKVYRECGPWRENVLRRMESDGVKVVFVAHFDRLLSAATKIPPWQKEWRAGLRGTLDELESRGIVPVLMEDTPWPGQDVPTCLSRNFASVD
ncbi:MAG: acyltransferase family protein, partial [Actinomycetota bacterium]